MPAAGLRRGPCVPTIETLGEIALDTAGKNAYLPIPRVVFGRRRAR
jgi:hypothetical protein